MCETPLAEASKSLATASEKDLDDVDHTFAGNPKRKVRCSKAAVSLDCKTKVIEPVGLGEGLARCQRCQKRAIADVDLHMITNKYFTPTKQRDCQSLRLAEHKGLIVQM